MRPAAHAALIYRTRKFDPEVTMVRRLLVVLALLGASSVWFTRGEAAADERAFGRNWGHTYNTHDWERFYHYPYVYYPQNYWGNEYYRSAESLYYRYPQEMRIPVYNKKWHNPYPQGRKTFYGPSPTMGLYHWGHHHILDVF
jgi:hypothetical protein